jgi:hypothetical protein
MFKTSHKLGSEIDIGLVAEQVLTDFKIRKGREHRRTDTMVRTGPNIK